MEFNRKLLMAAVLGTCMAVTTPTFAQDVTDSEIVTSVDDPIDGDVFNMSLDELLNMEITVASKKSEKLSDAPGMITSYSKGDIERYGYYTLKDLSNITSGYSSFSAFGETNMETRGQKAGSWNANKHLLLIDGIPVNHARANSAPLEYQVPLFFADRVEFLKGPGSALYGTSAFYGVMSVTSKQLKENGTLAEGRISYGDAGNSKRFMANASVKTDIGVTNISFSHFKKGFSGDSLGKNNNAYHFNNDNSTFLNGSFKLTDTKLKGLGVGMIYMNRNSFSGEHWGTSVLSPNNSEDWEEVITYVKYERELSDKLRINSYLKHNISTETGTYAATWSSFWNPYNDFQSQLAAGGGTRDSVTKDASYTGYTVPNSAFSYKTADIEALAEATYDINDKSSVIVGANFFSRKELEGPDSFEWDTAIPFDTIKTGTSSNQYNFREYSGSARVNVASAYLQYQNTFDVLEGLILTAGGRFDNGFSDVGRYSQFSPRAGLVLKATDKLNVKALYGQALRTPGIREIQGNFAAREEIKELAADPKTADEIPDVGAEVIKSVEVGINYNTPLRNGKSNLSIALASFYNITTNPLDGIQLNYLQKNGKEGNPNIFLNANGSIEAYGGELDVQFAASENLRFMANHAFAKAYNISEDDELSSFIDVPTQKTNFATTFILPGSFKLASTAVVRHMWGYKVAHHTYDDANADNNVLSGYTMLDLNFQIPLNEYFGVEAQIRNVLDTQWKQPSLLGQNSMIPLDRRNYLLTVYAKF